VLTRFDAEGRGTTQEVLEGAAKIPTKKLFLAPDGSVVAQCLDTNGDGRFDARASVENGQVTEALLDTDGNGKPDQREIYAGGRRVKLQADTNGDRRPDVIQSFEGDAVVRQEEDANYDGKIDRAFQGTAAAPITDPKAPAALPGLDCGAADAFWASL
jgi:hypothetical protein